MAGRAFPQVKSLRSPTALRERLAELGADLPVDDEVSVAPEGPLAAPLEVAGLQLANRVAILPMEGWDGTVDGRPTDLVRRRWRRFGQSGAALIWGGEAVAVRAEGRANPNQLLIDADAVGELAALRAELVGAHGAAGGDIGGLAVGLQLTHSGRWARPDGAPAPRTAQRHSVLDRRVGLDSDAAADAAVLSDDELAELADAYVDAAELVAGAGFDFVDIKACHGYLVHELLGAYDRPPPWGGAELADRARFLVGIVERVRRRVPDLAVGVRLSAFDLVPYRPGSDGTGEPEWSGDGAHDEPRRFGARPPLATGAEQGLSAAVDLAEPAALVRRLVDAGTSLLCVSAGSPYYNPHIQRPAYFPPSDGYQPPEDPLVGVARLQAAARQLAAAHPELVVVGSGLSYLQEFVGHVAQPLVRERWMDVAGLGRMALSYPTLPSDLLAGRPLERRFLCRTFSDCTTAPRHGLVSGCYPLDPFYKERPERAELAQIKRRVRRGATAATQEDDE